MTIGEAAQVVGVSTKAIRLWEAKGLLPGIERTPGGYRLFRENDLTVMRFIHQAQMLGITLGQIKHILSMQQAGTAPCECVAHLLDERIAAIDRTLNDLTQLRHTLLAARKHAEVRHTSQRTAWVCHIIEADRPDA